MTPTVAAADVKLFEVTVTCSASFVVAARNYREARKLAEEYGDDELMDARSFDVEVEGEIDAGSRAAKRYADDLPYGLDDVGLKECTVAEVLEGALAEDEEAPLSEVEGPVHWCHGCGFARVRFDWSAERQLCRECKEREEVA